MSEVNNLMFIALPYIRLPIILMTGIVMLVDILIVSSIDIWFIVLLNDIEKKRTKQITYFLLQPFA